MGSEVPFLLQVAWRTSVEDSEPIITSKLSGATSSLCSRWNCSWSQGQKEPQKIHFPATSCVWKVCSWEECDATKPLGRVVPALWCRVAGHENQRETNSIYNEWKQKFQIVRKKEWRFITVIRFGGFSFALFFFSKSKCRLSFNRFVLCRARQGEV
jgi:hypothetical protein